MLEPPLFEAAAASYSADTIGTKGTVRRPFRFEESEWVSIGNGVYPLYIRNRVWHMMPHGTENSHHHAVLPALSG